MKLNLDTYIRISNDKDPVSRRNPIGNSQIDYFKKLSEIKDVLITREILFDESAIMTGRTLETQTWVQDDDDNNNTFILSRALIEADDNNNLELKASYEGGAENLNLYALLSASQFRNLPVHDGTGNSLENTISFPVQNLSNDTLAHSGIRLMVVARGRTAGGEDICRLGISSNSSQSLSDLKMKISLLG